MPFRSITSQLLAALIPVLWAAQIANSAAEDSPWYAQTLASFYKTGDPDEQQSLFAKEAYLQRQVSDKWGIYAHAYHDEEFLGVYSGISRIVGKVELGAGLGLAEYEDERWLVINPWAYFSDGPWECQFYFEYTPEEVDGSRLFYRIYGRRLVGDRFYGGVYAERWFGAGPLIGVFLSDGLEARLSVPIGAEGEFREMSWITTVAYTF